MDVIEPIDLPKEPIDLPKVPIELNQSHDWPLKYW